MMEWGLKGCDGLGKVEVDGLGLGVEIVMYHGW